MRGYLYEDIILKNKIVAIILLTLLSTPVYSEDSVASVTTTSEKQEIPFKEPLGNKKLIMKFLYAMGGVVVSSMTLFIGLSIYNKIRNRVITTTCSNYTNTLQTPNNLKDSINIYLERTKD